MINQEEKMRRLLFYTEKLKHLPRSGWLRKKINTPETVAAHSWQMAMMAMQLSRTMIKDSYDFDKIIKMCLSHDIAESLIGDITPLEEIYAQKPEAEKKAIDFIAEDADIPEIIFLFREYEENKTPEAQLAHDLDKLDMYAQSIDYEKKDKTLDLSEFRQSAEKEIKTPLGKAILKELSQELQA